MKINSIIFSIVIAAIIALPFSLAETPGRDSDTFIQILKDKGVLNSSGSFSRQVSTDGADGSPTFDGVTTYNNFSSLSGSTYTLTRDVSFINPVVSTGVIIFGANYKICWTGTFTVNGTGHIHCDGASAVADIGGTVPAAAQNGSLTTVSMTDHAGVNGGTGAGTIGNTVAVNVQADTNLGIGGAGGAGSAGTGGGASSFSNTYDPGYGNIHSFPQWASFLTQLPSGSNRCWVLGGGGASGGGDSSHKGGGGGAGGMNLALIGNTLALSSSATITCNGGNGGAGGTGNCGGGGAGAGGILVVDVNILTINGVIATSTPTNLQATSGTGGTKTGTGVAGSAGQAGLVIFIQNK